MADAVFIQSGEKIDYTPGANVAAGDVVIVGQLHGVAERPILANEVGAIALAGVFSIAKAVGAGVVINSGDNTYYDATNALATRDATNHVFIGHAVNTAGNSANAVAVRLRN